MSKKKKPRRIVDMKLNEHQRQAMVIGFMHVYSVSLYLSFDPPFPLPVDELTDPEVAALLDKLGRCRSYAEAQPVALELTRRTLANLDGGIHERRRFPAMMN